MTIVQDDEMGGDARIDGTRIAVYHIVQYREAGFDADEIADEFDLPVEEVREALDWARENSVETSTTIIQDDKLAGEPRLAGHRITVLSVVTAVDDFGGVDEAARELRIDSEDVRDALEYARAHPEEMDEIRAEWDELIDDVS